MTKFHVTVLEHRNHTVEIEAADEDEALEAVQQRIYGKPTHHEGERLDALRDLVIASTTTLVEATDVEQAQAHPEAEHAADWKKVGDAVFERETVHREFRAAGFTEEWTGGNCRAWRKQIGAYSLWISDEGAGLGDTRDEQYGITLCERRGDESIGMGEDHDVASASGTQSEVLELARFAERSPRDFALAHPL